MTNPRGSADMHNFLLEISNFTHILIMSAKLATLGLFKTKVFSNKSMTSQFLSMKSPKYLSHYSNYIIDLVM